MSLFIVTQLVTVSIFRTIDFIHHLRLVLMEEVDQILEHHLLIEPQVHILDRREEEEEEEREGRGEERGVKEAGTVEVALIDIARYIIVITTKNNIIIIIIIIIMYYYIIIIIIILLLLYYYYYVIIIMFVVSLSLSLFSPFS